MTWQKWGEVRSDRHRSHAWTATSMGDAKGLVKVEVADISSKVTGS
jgi:Zn-dependent membrane protease YugP